MKSFKKLWVIGLLVVSTQLSMANDAIKTVNMKVAVNNIIPSQTKNIDWVTIKDLKNELPKEKIVVGFDIDDTILFSSPVFYYGKQKYSPNGFEYLDNQDFWNEASTGLDKFSVPKKSGEAVVLMHLKRGDTVYFVTGRVKPTNKPETVTQLLQNLFPEKYRAQIKSVVFTNGLEKEKQLKKANIVVFYGDADADITSAKKAGARGVRFLRNAQSTNKPLPEVGKYGEEVLIGSNY